MIAFPPTPQPLEVYLLGLVDFEEVQALQRRMVYDLGERGGAALILCEHPPTISVGRSGSRLHLLPDDETLKAAFAGFSGVKRRFTKTGVSHGVTVIDDYGHHPVEIAAVLSAARQAAEGNVFAVVQPHRYTRLASLFDDFCRCFNDADTVIVADVYGAGEQPIPGIDKTALVEGLLTRGHRHVLPLGQPDDLARMIRGLAKPGDLVVCLGAGSITNWANALPAELDRLWGATGRQAR